MKNTKSKTQSVKEQRERKGKLELIMHTWFSNFKTKFQKFVSNPFHLSNETVLKNGKNAHLKDSNVLFGIKLEGKFTGLSRKYKSFGP